MSTQTVSKCRAACPTGGHATWGECARAAHIQVPVQESQQHWGNGYTSKTWDKELDSYRKARADGIQPQSTKQKDIDAAVEVSRKVGKQFDATTGTFGEGQ